MKQATGAVVIFVCGIAMGVAVVPSPHVELRNAVEDFERCMTSLEIGTTLATQIRNRTTETLELTWPELQRRSDAVENAHEEYRRITAARTDTEVAR